MNRFSRRNSIGLGVVAVILAVISFNNCGQFVAKENANGADSLAVPNPNTASVTFSKDVRPIIQNRCTSCHQPGGITPFSLVNYQQVKSQSAFILQNLKSRKMPPWGAKDDGSCQSFHGSQWLSPIELSTFQSWVDQNMAEGTAMPDITLAAAEAHYNLNDPSVVEYKMPGSYVPPTGTSTDNYRCFVTDEASADRLVTGFDVVAGNLNVVHHILAFVPSSEGDEANAIAKGQGYNCFGGPGVAASLAAFWAPGTGPTTYPVINSKQTGLKIPAGRKLILQVHYNYAQGLGSDQSSVRFKLSNAVVKEGLWLVIGKTGGPETIPPGRPSYDQIENSQIGTAISGVPSATTVPGYIYAIFPHMHQAGSKIKIELNRDARARNGNLENECLVDVPAWDFHWQRIYWVQKPIPADALDNIKMTCTYNTQGRTLPTAFGENSSDEMCLMFAFVTDSQI